MSQGASLLLPSFLPPRPEALPPSPEAGQRYSGRAATLAGEKGRTRSGPESQGRAGAEHRFGRGGQREPAASSAGGEEEVVGRESPEQGQSRSWPLRDERRQPASPAAAAPPPRRGAARSGAPSLQRGRRQKADHSAFRGSAPPPHGRRALSRHRRASPSGKPEARTGGPAPRRTASKPTRGARSKGGGCGGWRAGPGAALTPQR